MTRTQLGDIATFVSGGTPNRAVAEYYRGDVPWITGADIDDSGNISPRFKITAEAVQKSATNIVQAGALVLVTRTAVGKVAMLDRATAISQDLTGVIPHAGISPDYIRNFLKFSARSLVGQARGATIKGVTRRVVASLQVPVLPLVEQQRIAGILDQADAIRTKRRASLALFDELLGALFYATFAGPRDSFDYRPLKDFVTLEGGRNLVAEDPNVNAPYRVLKISSVTAGVFKENENKALPVDYQPPAHHLVKKGDLLISRANTSQLVGAVAHVQVEPKNLVLPDKIWRINFLDQGSSPTFYREMLRLPSFRAKISRASSGTSGSMKNISKTKLLSLMIPAVPVQLQQEFAARVEQIHAQRALVERALEKDEELFASLQSRAFSGEL